MTAIDRRPARLVGVVGTGTEVGKTWASVRLLTMLRARGLRVAARKPVQSFGPDEPTTDAQRLAEATGEPIEHICPAHRNYPLAMAPPMAADALRRAAILLTDLLMEIAWPAGTDIGLIETVGGARSPLAHDGDSAALIKRIPVDEVLLVADAGLGVINSVRLTLDCLLPLPVIVLMNRFDETSDLQRRNRAWLADRGVRVITAVEEWR